MPFDYAIVNAFTTSAGPHSGNQAAVVIQSSPRPDSWKALVARDFNFSETAYVEPLSPGRWRLRWFTPAIEAELCGHATLASAAVLFERDPSLTMIEFETRWAGELRAEKVDDGIEIALPTIPQGALNKLEDETVAARQKEEVLEALLKAIPQLKHEEVKQVFKWPWGGEESCIIEIEGSVPLKDLKVEGKAMLAVSKGMNVVTQTVPSEDGTLHINTRVFVPGAGIDEDPVTGSAHAYLAGYFNSPRVRGSLSADPSIIISEQQSERGGQLRFRKDGDMVKITGKASIWASGTLRG